MSTQLVNRRGWLAGTRFIVLLVIGILWALPATARDRPVILIGIVDAPKDSETGLFVGDVNLLYDVLDKLWNDPAGLGLASSSATIQLAENAIYRLDPTKPEAGRVKLPFGTRLLGGNQYTDDRDEDGNPGADGIPDAIDIDAMTGHKTFASQETILDGRFLTGDRTVIEAGLANSIRNLTVCGARDPVPGGANSPGAEIGLLLTDQDNVGASRLTVSSARRGGGASRSLVITGLTWTSGHAGAFSATTRTPRISRGDSSSAPPQTFQGSDSQLLFTITEYTTTG